MKFAIRLFAAVAIALSVSGCALTDKIGNAYTSITSTTVSTDAVTYAASAFDAVQITATNYLRLRRCTGDNGPICRDPAITPQIIALVKAGREERNALKRFVRAHPGELGMEGTYAGLKQTTQSLQNLLAAYKAATA